MLDFPLPGTWHCRLDARDFGRLASLGLCRIDDHMETVAIEAIGLVKVEMTDKVPDALHGYFPEMKRMLQAIVDEAWVYGIRPSGYGAETNAQRFHLEDMRRLVFKDGT